MDKRLTIGLVVAATAVLAWQQLRMANLQARLDLSQAQQDLQVQQRAAPPAQEAGPPPIEAASEPQPEAAPATVENRRRAFPPAIGARLDARGGHFIPGEPEAAANHHGQGGETDDDNQATALQEQLDGWLDKAMDRVDSLVSEAVQEGELSPEDAVEVTQLLLDELEGTWEIKLDAGERRLDRAAARAAYTELKQDTSAALADYLDEDVGDRLRSQMTSLR